MAGCGPSLKKSRCDAFLRLPLPSRMWAWSPVMVRRNHRQGPRLRSCGPQAACIHFSGVMPDSAFPCASAWLRWDVDALAEKGGGKAATDEAWRRAYRALFERIMTSGTRIFSEQTLAAEMEVVGKLGVHIPEPFF